LIFWERVCLKIFQKALMSPNPVTLLPDWISIASAEWMLVLAISGLDWLQFFPIESNDRGVLFVVPAFH
jgi:hypothetical protein